MITRSAPARWNPGSILLLAAVAAAVGSWVASAGPTGMSVLAGRATAARSGSTTKLTVSSDAVVRFSTLRIGPGQELVVEQPSSDSTLKIQVDDDGPLQFDGAIHATGVVVMNHPGGFRFGPASAIQAASFTAECVPADPAAGARPDPQSPPVLGSSLVSEGRIEAAPGGAVVLRADAVDHRGALAADGGLVSIQCRTLSQAGLVQANTVEGRGGRISLVASEEIRLGSASRTLADGDSLPTGHGGRVVILSGGSYADEGSAIVSAAGGPAGGNGGDIEISALNLGPVRARVGAPAGPGGHAGTLLLDPVTITIDASGHDSPGDGTVGAAAPGSPTIDPAALAGFSQITLEAKSLISVQSPLILPDQPGGAFLTLRSGGDIRLTASGLIQAGLGWKISLIAGATFATPTGVKPGTGSIVLAGPAAISGADGPVVLIAGKDINVGQGFVHTTAGGSIGASAGGSINTGSSQAGYQFGLPDVGYAVDIALGGISTAAGGDVTLAAGKDVTSFLPTSGSYGDAGSGAFGPQPGNVTISAGGGVFGHFVLANGAGSVTAGLAAGATRQLALSLVKGSWAVAAQDITLQEVRNPLGMFNLGMNQADPNRHRFDYAQDASVTLAAQGSVALRGESLPRNSGERIPIVYPGSLKIAAGAGGIRIGNSLTLMPSPVGQLAIRTTAGGGLVSSNSQGGSVTLGMSDSGSSAFTGVRGQFGQADHAAIPVHLGDPLPVQIDVSGTMNQVNLVMPKATRLAVGGDMIESSLLTQNLAPTDKTSVSVAGKIINRNLYTAYPLPANIPPPPLAELTYSDPPILAPLTFDPNVGKYGTVFCAGALTLAVADALCHWTEDAHDGFGHPILDPGTGNPIIVPGPEILPCDFLHSIVAGSADSGTSSSLGLIVGGPGRLEVGAESIDLGLTPGIQATGPGYNPALAKISPLGAGVDVATAGDITMDASSIISLAGGPLDVHAGGAITVGSPAIPPSGKTFVAQGIFSTGGSPVTVSAGGNISVYGAHIATYDGGNLSVISTGGNVNAGDGPLEVQQVTAYMVDSTGAVRAQTDIIPGSGILTATFSYGGATVGDILVETPRGDILAGPWGIFQAQYNGPLSPAASLCLRAGTPASGLNPGFLGDIRVGIQWSPYVKEFATGTIGGPNSTNGPPIVRVIRDASTGVVRVSWTLGSLQESPSPAGPFTPVDATSPLILAPGQKSMFYRAVD